MNETFIDNDNGPQVPQQSSVSLDCGNQAPLQSLPSQDIGTQNTPVAAVSRDQAISTDPTQGSEAQATPMATLISDETRLSKEVSARRGYVLSLVCSCVYAVPALPFSALLIIIVLTQKALPGRCSQNGYLTKMNDELFRPRGLYCLIMSYDVKSRSNVMRPGQGDSPSHVIREGISSGSKSNRMRGSDGILGASNFPEVAKLIYPDPENLPENNV